MDLRRARQPVRAQCIKKLRERLSNFRNDSAPKPNKSAP
jgi:hypothetical protein